MEPCVSLFLSGKVDKRPLSGPRSLRKLRGFLSGSGPLVTPCKQEDRAEWSSRSDKGCRKPSGVNHSTQMRLTVCRIVAFFMIITLASAERCFAQKGQRLPVSYGGKEDSTYTVFLQKRVNPNAPSEERYEYWLRLEGYSKGNQQLKWTYEERDGTGGVVSSTACITLRRMERLGRDVRIATAPDFGRLCLDRLIVPEPIVMPRRDQFSVKVVSPEGGLLFKGDTIVMKVESSGVYSLTEWGWKTANDKEMTGPMIHVVTNQDLAYWIYGKFQGCDANYVYSDSLKFPIVLKDRNDLDFRIVGPESRIDDTSFFKLGIEVTRDLLGEKLEWKWYKSVNGRKREVGQGLSYQEKADSVLTDSVYTACAYARGREVRCKNYVLRLRRLPGPDAFDLFQPDSIDCSTPLSIVARSRGRKPQRWTWTIDGVPAVSYGDTLVIAKPREGQRVCAYPTLNRRGGPSLRKCILVGNCQKAKHSPFSIGGRMKRCAGDTSETVYHFRGHLATRDPGEEWWLYANGRRERRILYGSDTVQLRPTVTTSYKVLSTLDSARYFDFMIEVVPRPDSPESIVGPDIVCKHEEFRLMAGGGRLDSVRWVWMRSDLDGGATKRIEGAGDSVRDSLESPALYTLFAERSGCRSLVSRTKIVQVKEWNSTPHIKKMRYRKRGSSVDIELSGAVELGETYEWSDDEFRTIAHVGKDRKSLRLGMAPRLIHVRIRNDCGLYSDILEVTLPGLKRFAEPVITIRVVVYKVVVRYGVLVTPRVVVVPERTIRVESDGYPGVFINTGMVTNGADLFQNFRLTVGRGRIYGSVFFNPIFLLAAGDHERTYAGRTLEVTGAGRVANFPPSTGNYYVLNGESLSNRTGLALGVLFNLRYLNLSVGTGYGTRTLYWGVDINSYTNDSRVSRIWTRNKEGNWRGLTLDAGVFKDFGGFNLMLCMHAILDPDKPIPYTEMGIGLGINLGK
jgi:hypothetical protein